MRRQDLRGHPFVPVMLDLAAGQVLVVGGGQAATTKVRSLAASGARIRVVAPCISPAIQDLARTHPGIRLVQREFRPRDLGRRTWLIARLAALLLPAWLSRRLDPLLQRHSPASPVLLACACTDSDRLNLDLARACLGRGIPVCNTGDPAGGSCIFPGVLREGPFILALGSGGQDLAAGRRIRTTLEPAFRQLARQAAGGPGTPPDGPPPEPQG